jgi:predicted small secreted protein
MDRHPEEETLKNRLLLTLATFGIIAMMSALSACHTAAGAGEDISDGGKAIEHSAERP